VTLTAGTVGTSDSMRREVFVPAVTAAELVVEESSWSVDVRIPAVPPGPGRQGATNVEHPLVIET